MNQPIQKILLISHHLPPDFEVGGKRIAQFSRYLPEFGFTPIVLSVNEAFWAAKDDSFAMPDGLAIYRTTVVRNPITLYGQFKKARNGPARIESGQISGKRPISGGLTNTSRLGISGWIRKQVFSVFDSPNDDCGWYLPAVKAARRIIETEGIDIVFSSGPPWAAHLIAWNLKKHYEVRWLADFRDPWTLGAEWGNLPSWRRALERRLEELCMKTCDAVICNTDRIRNEFMAAYPLLRKEKFVTITNGFGDLRQSPPPIASNNNRRVMAHLGSMYGARQSDLFFEAIANVVRSGISANSFKLLLVGDTDPEFVSSLSTRFPDLFETGCVEFKPRVSWQAAQDILWKADLLLLFQGGYTLQVPAKFYEYLPTGKPILVVAKDGALTDIVKLTNSGACAAPDDVPALEKAFLEVLSSKGRTPGETEREIGSEFHFRSLTRKLAIVAKNR